MVNNSFLGLKMCFWPRQTWFRPKNSSKMILLISVIAWRGETPRTVSSDEIELKISLRRSPPPARCTWLRPLSSRESSHLVVLIETCRMRTPVYHLQHSPERPEPPHPKIPVHRQTHAFSAACEMKLTSSLRPYFLMIEIKRAAEPRLRHP